MGRLVTRAVISWLLTLAVALACVGHVEAQTKSSQSAAARIVSSDHAGPALAGGITAVASAALLLGGSVAIAVVDDRDSERLTRGLSLGVTALSVPSAAIMAWVTRKRAGVEGFSAIRSWGWTAWTGAVVNSALQWALVLDNRSVSPAITMLGGALGALGASIHALDAFATARRAHLRFYYQIGPTAFTANLTF